MLPLISLSAIRAVGDEIIGTMNLQRTRRPGRYSATLITSVAVVGVISMVSGAKMGLIEEVVAARAGARFNSRHGSGSAVTRARSRPRSDLFDENHRDRQSDADPHTAAA